MTEITPHQTGTGLPWARPLAWIPGRAGRCRAAVEPGVEPEAQGPYGRCDLVTGHDGDHALDFGDRVPR